MSIVDILSDKIKYLERQVVMYESATATLSDDINFHFKRIDTLVNSQQNQINELNNFIMTFLGNDNLPISRIHSFNNSINFSNNGANNVRGTNLIKLPSPNYLTPVQTSTMSTNDSVMMNNIDTISRASTSNALTKSNIPPLSHIHSLPDPITKSNSNTSYSLTHSQGNINTANYSHTTSNPMYVSNSVQSLGNQPTISTTLSEPSSIPLTTASTSTGPNSLPPAQSQSQSSNMSYTYSSNGSARNGSLSNLYTKNSKLSKHNLYVTKTESSTAQHGNNIVTQNSTASNFINTPALTSPVSIPMESHQNSSVISHNSINHLNGTYSAPMENIKSISMEKSISKKVAKSINMAISNSDPLSSTPKHSKFIINQNAKRRRNSFRGVFEFVKSPQSVADIWNEYTKGFNGQPSIKEMEEIHKTSWRRDPAVNKRYARRKVLWKAIENGLKKGLSLDTTIQMLEEHRYTDRAKGTKEPIGWLCQRNSIPEVLRN